MEGRYFLTTSRIGFSEWHPDDKELAQTLWGDREVTRLICASGQFTPEEIQKRLNNEVANNAQYHVQYWPIFTLATGELIGCCGLRPHGHEEYEMGFHLRPKFWRQGYATEAAAAVIRYAFTALGAKRLFAGHNPKNAPSRRVLRKLGFAYIGEEFYEPTGLYHPSYELENDIAIRPAKPADAERIGLVHYRAWMETYTGMLPDSFLSSRSPEKSAAVFRASQCENTAVIEARGEIVGFCGWGAFRDDLHDPDTGEIYGIYLLNQYKRMHLGRKLLAYALSRLKMDGYEKAGLWVLEDNQSAIRFYEKQGFRCGGMQKEADLGKTVREWLYLREIE